MKSNKKQSKNFYDIDQIKEIPIVDVCESLGIEVVSRGSNLKCKLRDERTPSTVLYTNNGRNEYHDFGTGEHGDVIQLVSSVLKVDRGEAISILGERFSLEPLNKTSHQDMYDLTAVEYIKIGIHGDLATKNFVFDVENTSTEAIANISQKYAMPMNELRKKHPKTYERVLRQKAIPFVNEMRNSYYLDVYSEYKFCEQYGCPELFYKTEDSIKKLDRTIKELKTAERILKRAVKGTSIKLHTVEEYEPLTDLAAFKEGKIKPKLNNVSYYGMNYKAKTLNTSVKYFVIDSLAKYYSISGKLEPFYHSAYLTKDSKIVVGYLESDKEKIHPIFESTKEKKAPKKKELNQIIEQANETRKRSVSQKEKEPQSRSGFER